MNDRKKKMKKVFIKEKKTGISPNKKAKQTNSKWPNVFLSCRYICLSRFVFISFKTSSSSFILLFFFLSISFFHIWWVGAIIIANVQLFFVSSRLKTILKELEVALLKSICRHEGTFSGRTFFPPYTAGGPKGKLADGISYTTTIIKTPASKETITERMETIIKNA